MQLQVSGGMKKRRRGCTFSDPVNFKPTTLDPHYKRFSSSETIMDGYRPPFDLEASARREPTPRTRFYSLTTQAPPPLDARYSVFDWKYDLGVHGDSSSPAKPLLPPTDNFQVQPALHPPLQLSPNHSIGSSNNNAIEVRSEWKNLSYELEPYYYSQGQGQGQPSLMYGNITSSIIGRGEIVKVEKVKSPEKEVKDQQPVAREESYNNGGSLARELSRDVISKYFYMPITQAARELNIGLTALKKRCRELGIRRWPHRKLMSIQTLIKNVQEMGKGEGGVETEEKVNDAIRMLEQEKRMLEEIPDMQLEMKTKKLRQAYFKANYKKRKLMEINDIIPSDQLTAATTSVVDSSVNGGRMFDYDIDEDDDELRSLLSEDSFSYSSCPFF